MGIVTRAVVVGLFWLGSVLSGLWLRKAGRPLNVGISTIHKLISLVAAVYLVATAYQRNQQTALGAAEWIAVVVSGLCFVAMGASGAVLTSNKPVPTPVLRVHQIVPTLTALATGIALYLLLGG